MVSPQAFKWPERFNTYFLFDLIIVSIHLTEHYCLVVVDIEKKTMKFYTSIDFPHRECLQVDEVLFY